MKLSVESAPCHTEVDKILLEMWGIPHPTLTAEDIVEKKSINIETRRSSTLEKRVILVQGPC